MYLIDSSFTFKKKKCIFLVRFETNDSLKEYFAPSGVAIPY